MKANIYKKLFIIAVLVYVLTLYIVFFFFKPIVVVVTPVDEQGNTRLLIAQYPRDLRIFATLKDPIAIKVGYSIEDLLRKDLGYGKGIMMFHFPNGITNFSGTLRIYYARTVKSYGVKGGIVVSNRD